MKSKLLLPLLLLCLPLAAQTAPPKATPPKPPVAAPAPPPQLSELDKTKLENFQLKFSLLSNQQTALQNEYQAWVQALVAAHPGYTWNPQAGTLVPVPPPSTDKK